MDLERLEARWHVGGWDSVADVSSDDPLGCFYLAVLAFAASRPAEARRHAQRAAELDPASLVYPLAAAYLARVVASGKEDVYRGAEGFAAFIRGGGNVALYAATSAALRELYGAGPLRLLDLGAGDGLALLPALTAAVRAVDVVEPSATMLARAVEELERRGVPYRAFAETAERFRARPGGGWDLIQATFSLQSVRPEERPALLGWMRAHAPRVAIVEFDVPLFADALGAARVRHVLARYERGLAEYVDDRELVAQGFLMPVLFGGFDPTRARTNFEGPIAAWEEALRSAGFAAVRSRRLCSYWWAEAFLVEAGAR